MGHFQLDLPEQQHFTTKIFYCLATVAGFFELTQRLDWCLISGAISEIVALERLN